MTATTTLVPPPTIPPQMAALRRLVREERRAPNEAAVALGIDPLIAMLWLRLPDDLWPTVLEQPTSVPAQDMAHQRSTPLHSLSRVPLTAFIPLLAYSYVCLQAQERGGDGMAIATALDALRAGLAEPLPAIEPGHYRLRRRSLFLLISAAEYTRVEALAAAHFGGDMRKCAGWLIARGLRLQLPLPAPEELRSVPLAPRAEPRPVSLSVTFDELRRRKLERRERFNAAKASLLDDTTAPDGEELARRRAAVGISQRELAAQLQCSRGLVAEIERGRRRHVLTRLRMAETLATLEREAGR